MAYPRVYEATETVFTHNGLGVLSECIRATLTEELNGVFEIEIEHAFDSRGKWLNLVEGNNIKVDGQLFRIYHKKKTINSIVVNARHIFYDLLNNIVETLELIGANGVAAITSLISNAQWASGFTVSGDHNVTGDFSFLRQNIVDCILGNDGITKTIGGELELDNKVIKIWNSRGSDRGVLISCGKNIVGIEETLDMDGICTRLMPVGKDNLLLAAKYVDASNIGNFVHPKIRVVEFNDIDNIMDLEAAAVAYFAKTQCNIPTANYKIDFIELTKTEQYKNYAILESVALGDTVTVKHSVLGIDLKCKVIKTVKNCITDRIEKIELGSFNSNIANSISTQIQKLKSTVDFVKSDYALAVENATKLITGETGGFVKIICDDTTGEPEAIAIMDTDDVSTAQKVWLWNNSGLGFSSTGIAGPYETAITSDGSIVATFITTGALDANIVKVGWNGIASTVQIDSTGLTVTNGAITIKNSNNVDILAKTEDDINLQKLNTSGFTKVINGNFLDTSSWTPDYSSLSVATVGELKCATGSTKSATAGAEQTLTGLTVGHRYYITAEIKPLYSRASEWGFNGATKAIITAPTINVWNKKGIITTATSTSHVLYLNHNTLSQYATNDVFRFRNVIVVDLDSIYGSDIPSLEWCDANIGFSKLASGIVKAGFNDVSANILLDAEGITVTDGAIVVKNSNNDDAFYIDSSGRASTDSSFVEYDGTNGGGIEIGGNVIYKIPGFSDESKKLYIEADYDVHVKSATDGGQGNKYKSVLCAGVDLNSTAWGGQSTHIGATDYEVWYVDFFSAYNDAYMHIYAGSAFLENLYVNSGGDKNKLVETSVGTIGMEAYETTVSMFGDIGSGKILSGSCMIGMDPIFAETVNTEVEYHVFLTKYGVGDIYVSERTPTYFLVKGTEGLEFSWEIKAVQKGNESKRMKPINVRPPELKPTEDIVFVNNELSYITEGGNL